MQCTLRNCLPCFSLYFSQNYFTIQPCLLMSVNIWSRNILIPYIFHFFFYFYRCFYTVLPILCVLSLISFLIYLYFWEKLKLKFLNYNPSYSKKNFSTICIKYLGQVVVWIMHIDLYIYWCNHPLLNIGLNQLLICGQLGMWRNKIRMWTDSTRSLHFMIKLFQEY